MDDRWESEVIEYGAVNITGFRIMDQERPMIKEFMNEWMHFDVSPQNPKRQSISVSLLCYHFSSNGNIVKQPIRPLIYI